MKKWNWGVGLVLLALIGLPLIVPIIHLLIQPKAWLAWTEVSRLGSVLQNTFWLVFGTILFILPPGVVLAGLLYRSDLPGRIWWNRLIFLTLFIPLPLFASAWQSVLGTGGLIPIPFWNRGAHTAIAEGGLVWTPWGQGIGSAIWIHGLAGLPWVILFVGLGLGSVESDLEEDALTFMGPLHVFCWVSIRRSMPMVLVAALWVSIQITTEITITDLMQVRTYAEEVYTQMVAPDPLTGAVSGETRALAVALPLSLLVVFLLIALGLRTSDLDFQGLVSSKKSPTLQLGPWRFPCLLGVILFTIFYLGLPLFSLIWRTGIYKGGMGWSGQLFGRHLGRAILGEGRFVIQSLVVAGITGAVTASLALLACWCSRGSKCFLIGALGLTAAAWAWPGPVTGLGLKAVLQWVVGQSNSQFLAELLWHGPSLVPIIWVGMIRLFPVAVVLIWPALRVIPGDLLDLANLDGARSDQELFGIVIPMLKIPLLMAILAVTILSLGELSASKIVSTPASPSYAGELFAQMHYGVSNDLAARCFLLVVIVGCGGLALMTLKRTN